MRRARAQDYYRRIRERSEKSSVRLDRISFKGVPGLGEGDIPLSSVLTVLCGPNGVGKTSLLRAIWAALDPVTAAKKPMTTRKLSAGTATVDIQVKGQPVNCEVTFIDGEIRGDVKHDLEIVHIDSSSEVFHQQEIFCAFDSPDDIINGEGGRTLDDKELASLNRIAKREYRSVEIFEPELGSRIYPFFQITFGADRYDSRTMGAGELAAFYLWWALGRSKHGSIILIEEPECYLSPASQDALRDYIAKVTVERELCVVTTSHSSKIISPLPPECTRFFRRDNHGIKLVADTPPPIFLETLGISSSVDTLVFVEDPAGQAFCRLLLEQFDPGLARRTEIVVRHGSGEIVTALRQLRGAVKSLRLVGMFDGDQRGKVQDEVRKLSVHLPGEKPVELLFKEMIHKQPKEVGAALGQPDFETVLFALGGLDHHDWYERLSEHVGLTKQQLFSALYRIWMSDPANNSLAAACYEETLAVLEDVPSVAHVAA